MTSTPLIAGKSLSAPPPLLHSPASSQSNPSAGSESARRPTQVGPTASQAAPRKGQAARKQHRNQRKTAIGSTPLDDDDTMAELRAVRNPSSRRGQTSITHLMSYALPPRPYFGTNHHSHLYHSRSYRRNPGVGSAHDKARYVHANYRFVVSPNGNYATQAVDADEHLDWGDVLQVLASSESQQTSCPICLSEPVAPRMARCGHIFCLPCLIRFMNTVGAGDDGPPGTADRRPARWRKCPICDDTVYMAEVRPVRFYAGQESALPRPGDDVILRLMTRTAKSTLALPREGGVEGLASGEDVPWHFAANVLDYARIAKGTGDYMEEQYDREVEDLLRQEKEDELLFNEDNEWTQRAIRAISTAKEKVKGLGAAEVAVSAAVAAASSSAQTRQIEQDFYFYTSPPHLYLSPLDIRILKTKYGSFSAFPSTLLPRVEHISTGHVVDDMVRRRAKYLGHLPAGCLISFLECDWTDIVPPEVLADFADEIERRRRRNDEKAAQEERERLQAERIEAAAIRGSGRRTASSSAAAAAAAAIQEDEAGAGSGISFRLGTSVNSPHSATLTGLLDDFQPLGGASSTTPPNPRPGFAQLANISTSPSAQRTVWGTPAVAVSPEMGPAQASPVLDDGWLKDDDFLDSLGAAELAVQMEALGIEPESSNSATAAAAAKPGTTSIAYGGAFGGGGSSSGGVGAGNKRKKKQKITLMSTVGRRGT